MKKLIVSTVILLFTLNSYSQTTNIFEENGNVGIGLDNPTKQFQIGNISNNSALYNEYINTINHMIFDSKDSNDGGAFIFRSTKNAGVKDLVSISRFGDIGIGTTSPTASATGKILHLIVNGDKWPCFRLERENGSTKMNTAWETFISSDGSYYIRNVNENKIFSPFILRPEAPTNSFYMSGNGNIGMGTTITGTHKLAVNGTIGAREIKVEAVGWSDFVFEQDYQLKDLEEVESFIEENKRLPDVPSEKEVLENGIQLGEMDAKLLQKIEELTLYLIEQNKLIKSQKEELEQLKAEVKELKSNQ
jgi:hypothetical protein